MMDCIYKKIEFLYSKVVIRVTLCCSLFFFSLLFLLSISVTSDITITTDLAPYQYPDNSHLYLLIILPVFVMTFYKLKDIKISRKRLDTLQWELTILFSFIIFIFFGFAYADPEICLLIARTIAGEADAFELTSIYIGKYPHQSFFCLYECLYAGLFKKTDFIIYQLVSVVLFSGCIYLLRYIFEKIMKDDYTSFIDLALMFFVPGWLIAEFTYNDIHSLFFSVLSIYLFLKYSEKWSAIVFASYLMAIGCSLRSNNLILLIAFIVIEMYEEKNIRVIVFLVLSILCFKINNTLAYEYLITRFPDILNNAVNLPATRWLYIGLTESKTGAGWWAPDTANIVDYSSGKEQINNLLHQQMKEHFDHPLGFLSFQIRKMANGYTIPDYETLDAFRHKESLWKTPGIKAFLYNRNIAYQVLYEILNAFQSLLYFGNILYLALKKDKIKHHIFGIVFFLGNVLFYFFWEIKARYILPSTIFIIPTGVVGYQLLAKKINKKIILMYITLIPTLIFISQLIMKQVMTAENLSKLNSLVR
ncbi:hypothetical protein [Hungatella hathewayi]|uniref:hypothetical protein n=1 Tax=Hungatella hathewayi TaxID=154046 RepID=UPI003569D278